MRTDLGWSYVQAGALNTANGAGYVVGALVAEAGRLPDLARLFVERNPLRTLIIDVLQTYAGRGVIRLDDPRLMAEHFAILIVGVPRMMALFVGREQPAEEERRLRAAVRLFLNGCRAG
jgi:hypothetical protein